MSDAIRNVSDTAIWVAMYRALETERPDAIFRDPFARRLAGQRGDRITTEVPHFRSVAWPQVVRVAVMDEIIMRAVGEGVDTILNLAAGLDARAFRLPLPPALKWFDIDLPGMTEYRREHLADAMPGCVHEHVAADLTDPAVLPDVLRLAEGRRALMVTEGLLIYLRPEQVQALAEAAFGQAGLRYWLTDVASPAARDMMKRRVKPTLEKANAGMRFAVDDIDTFFGPLGWNEIEYRSIWEEGIRLNRCIRFAKTIDAVIRALGSTARRRKMLRAAGVVLLERQEA